MRILLVSEQFPPLIGGAGIYLYNLYSRLPQDEVVVYAQKREGDREFDSKAKMKIIRRWIWKKPFSLLHPTSILGPFWLFFSLLRQVFKEKIDIIHCGTAHPSGECALLFKKLLGLPYLVYVFGEELGYFKKTPFKRYIITRVLKNAGAIVTLSEYTRKMLIGLGISQDKIFKIPGGVNIPDGSLKRNNYLRQRLNLENKKVLLTVGRLTERKGHDVVIRAMPEVLKRYPEAAYIIVGAGNTEARLKELTCRLNLQDKVSFLGEVAWDKPADYYDLCDVFIMVNRLIPEEGDFEGFGLVFLEANAHAKPVIAGRSGGATDAVEDQVSGILINNPEDPKEVAGAILKLLSDESLAKRMGESGKKRAQEYFNWDKHKDIVLQINDVILKK